MRIILTSTGADCPVAAVPEKAKRVSASPDVHGAFSVQDFSYTEDLKHTHEDAEGFIKYQEKGGAPRNFWFKDKSVRNWAFTEGTDNVQDTYGVDAVLAVYFSSHGRMEADGSFTACMGDDWADQGHFASSFKMRIGNQQANYIWWSACESLRIRDGHDPHRSWGAASEGFRMMFGYETVSTDSGDYGGGFWEHWNEGKSFGSAFLDTSWDISSDQIPVAVAVGASAIESRNRVYNERMLTWDHVESDACWSCRSREKSAAKRRSPAQTLPRSPLIARLMRPRVDDRYVRKVLKQHRLDIPLPREVMANANGTFYVRHEDTQISFRADGSYEIEYAHPNLNNCSAMNEEDVIRIAESSIPDAMLTKSVDLQLNCIGYDRLAHIDRNTGIMGEPSTIETIVEFTQVVNGLPVVSPAQGKLRVSIDNDGRVTRIQNRLRQIEAMTELATNTVAGPGATIQMSNLDHYLQLLESEWQKRQRVRAARGKETSTMQLLPGTAEIGYEVVGDEMALYARGLIEVTMPGGFRKRYQVVQPIVE